VKSVIFWGVDWTIRRHIQEDISVRSHTCEALRFNTLYYVFLYTERDGISEIWNPNIHVFQELRTTRHKCMVKAPYLPLHAAWFSFVLDSSLYWVAMNYWSCCR
jgi:hypothetical protein